MAEKGKDVIDEEDADFIEEKLRDYIGTIDENLNKYESFKEDKDKVQAHFDALFRTFVELREYLAEIIFWLPSYTQQVFQKQIDSLHIRLNKEKDVAIPKSKFSFKRNKKAKTDKVKEESKIQVQEEVDEFSLIDETKDLVIKQLKGQKRIVLESEYEGKDKIYLTNIGKYFLIFKHQIFIENCDIYLPFIAKALYIKSAYYSRIYVGFVEGATFIISANNCSFNVASHQTRIHKANDCQFYLYAKQGPIIEDCSGGKFGPYMFSYPNKIKHQKESGFEDAKNLYYKVSDFNWFKKEKSPNFDVLDPEEIEALIPVVLENSDFK